MDADRDGSFVASSRMLSGRPLDDSVLPVPGQEATSPRSHVVITGTGRSGTTFLVALLTRLGLDTGFNSGALTLFPHARAGLEHQLHDPKAPYIIKSPYFCDSIEGELSTGRLRVDHAIIPVRRFEAAAASRAYVHAGTTELRDGIDPVPGGLWNTLDPDQQVTILREKFTRLVEALVRYDIPMHFLWYPRLARDADYLYSKIRFMIGDIGIAQFRAVFDDVVRPDWIHRFNDDDV